MCCKQFPKNKKNIDNNGFTLIEILIAITVFAIGILALGSMQISSMNGNADAQRITDASVLAQDQLEEVMALDYDDPLLNDDDSDGTNQDADDDGDDDDGGDFGLNDTTNPDGSTQIQIGTSRAYNVFWNVAVDEPATGNKIIRIIVKKTQGNQSEFSLDFIK